MRRFMIERLALHVGDLPVQLQAHCTAVYEHSPLPRILYPELKEELFCHRYYLRHLCDETRFAEWPIDEPVPLLQAILSAWQAELKKVPSSMSRSEALQVLAIKQEDLVGKTSEQIEPYLRRAYHKLAAKYHPDKNPDPSAREIFEKVQKAYEFMASERGHGGPRHAQRLINAKGPRDTIQALHRGAPSVKILGLPSPTKGHHYGRRGGRAPPRPLLARE